MPTPEGISDHDPRWRLRLLDESDAEDLYAAVDANRDHLARWLPWAAGQTLEGTLAFIRSTRRQLATNDGFQTAIVEDGRIIGMVGFHGVSWDHRSATHRLLAGRGRAGARHHDPCGASPGQLRVHGLGAEPGRDPSSGGQRAEPLDPERLGFRQEGVLRKAELVGDRYVDHAVYATLASEWSSAID